ncbi:hypothetical protein EJ06DRAFT_525114 [Trichodelitschia bisporula]|uniref:HAD-like protein n=1 Tax=Trichodelitschia bisporula TaxID=703511 RepID=A0A6G1HJC8_9PEZI|nr:hypothetical protein EJ06DRAFT_525114 [Trichodelitschia bisporula]
MVSTIIFDCENTLVLSEELAFETWAELTNEILEKAAAFEGVPTSSQAGPVPHLLNPNASVVRDLAKAAAQYSPDANIGARLFMAGTLTADQFAIYGDIKRISNPDVLREKYHFSPEDSKKMANLMKRHSSVFIVSPLYPVT